MNSHGEQDRLPETDEDVKKLLLEAGGDSAWTVGTLGIYTIKRLELGVLDAYLATLTHIIDIQEKKATK